jgi:hypothetical protein
MTKKILFLLLMLAFALNACAPQSPADPLPQPVAETADPTLSPQPLTASPSNTASSAENNRYINNDFGLSFQYPAAWFGPDEYVSGDTLRVSIGSDVVYPYGTDRTEQIYTLPNSYYLILQYTQNNQNTYWQETYQSLAGMQDGESFSDGRGRIIRVRQFDLGDFTGFEYIATLSDTAQTEPVYSREVILVDDQANLLTISGSPNNVEIGNGANWRDLYYSVDEQNQNTFHAILASITFTLD